MALKAGHQVISRGLSKFDEGIRTVPKPNAWLQSWSILQVGQGVVASNYLVMEISAGGIERCLFDISNWLSRRVLHECQFTSISFDCGRIPGSLFGCDNTG
ncbi:hypothetical protein PF002_g22638 [Phytophthora fragariae]|uniref:Uncharacterized protein n=1 Tax=Phytophthora fragariae TaxID=53985 RepID=A0A6A3QZ70_9STRA|nr:hypothetical protein PF007_g21567 [Phytophthora fragariae]KAE9197802.1 hypothetical protein PF002_g22638 [Phytophthora fragariae]KAE9291830.1 hypothetical protein PF008_g25230 [Phytophthora fragariae]